MREQPVKVRHAIEHADLVALVKERDDALAQIPPLKLLLSEVIHHIHNKPTSGDGIAAGRAWWDKMHDLTIEANSLLAQTPPKEKP